VEWNVVVAKEGRAASIEHRVDEANNEAQAGNGGRWYWRRTCCWRACSIAAADEEEEEEKEENEP